MSESKFSLVDLSALSKPVCKLIDAVSNCIGTLYEPRRIRRKAKAEADATLILAEADAERQALLKRAAHRLAIQEVRRQKNIENIINQAVESLPETVSDEPVDPDWVSRFFDECRDVSHADLQKLWARLLANEVAMPKSCSRKTLSILKDISPYDANVFKIFCSLLWTKDDDYFFPHGVSFSYEINIKLQRYGVNYNDCLHFESLGLIHCKDIMVTVNTGNIINYFEKSHFCYNHPSNMQSEIMCFPLTRSGIELISAIKPEFNWDYYIDSSMSAFADYNVYLACII